MTGVGGGAVCVAEGVLVEPRAVARVAAAATRRVAGVVGLEPTLTGFVVELGRRVRDVATGREAADPVDGVRVETTAGGQSVVVTVALSVGGRSARDVSVDVVHGVREALDRQLGVRVDRVEVVVVDVALIPPEAAEEPGAST
ncbi:putative conserved protein YloU, alkaline shock protein (Asp23) family [Streptoalloteichus tenebrarius]|uniref:Conserved protein YloU, alkaline shock protein (Asp23) family n=1 Tax=Streptoalloteichus tenebrarius (strain ATCC 17920 / DSM 40477 / JCM 4838 / CBS 697.72 / NBRC 16177 / NCIMB 11028 / NRRL B-12390 / A12253. 1 / ISP 5477) TaxID=1933 RepID=A0ABT1HRA7_STRSD|nr:Asp23/Gls24 family envelope stress response protein [Streptoalloteichus tenebrarius]MCP2258059.1 putative conserved protein YloU, alkaline shock protein (Asp23) family [Streptoalloteichus tenebrarius]BFF01730.1 hypothetical protein GCM10020241_34050 [Streptoalloteichus tenebrarius]